MAKYTKGEWGVATMDFKASNDEIYTDVDGVPVGIAQIFGPCTYSEATLDGKDEPHYLVSKEEAAANARLIAAAPRLASALRALLAEAESLHEAYNNKRESDGWSAEEEDESFVEARAALAKAEG